MAPRGRDRTFPRQLARCSCLHGMRTCGKVPSQAAKRGGGATVTAGRLIGTVALVAALAVAVPAPAVASGPKLTVPEADLQAAFNCPIDPTNATRTPLMFVTGRGATGDQGYLIGRAGFEAYGHPGRSRQLSRLHDRRHPGLGPVPRLWVAPGVEDGRPQDRGVRHQRGGLLPRFALTYWPDLRRKVSDVLSAAGTHHGTRVFGCSDTSPCAPANWQQAAGSNLLRALNAQPDETRATCPSPPSARRPTKRCGRRPGARPTSALEGARNILIQDVCPGRTTNHIGTAVDSVSFAAFVDGIEHSGKGKKGPQKCRVSPPTSATTPTPQV